MRENMALTKALEAEKLRAKLNLETSIVNEDEINVNENEADTEINVLKEKIKKLEKTQRSLLEELKTEKAIVGILKSDCDNLRENITTGDSQSSNRDFVFPKSPAKKPQVTPQYTFTSFNRFSPLSEEDSICIPTTHLEVIAEVHNPNSPAKFHSTVPRQTNKRKNLTILADSQGKSLYSHFGGLAQKYNVSVLTKPGAKLKHVVKEGRDFVGKSSSDDYVVLLAGTNDVGVWDPAPLTVTQGLRDLLTWDSPVTVIIFDIPYRYDTRRFNDDIFYLNCIMKRLTSNYTGPLRIIHVPTNDHLSRKHFTRHGLHLNKGGKQVIRDLVVDAANTKSATDTDDRAHPSQSSVQDKHSHSICDISCGSTSDILSTTSSSDKFQPPESAHAREGVLCEYGHSSVESAQEKSVQEVSLIVKNVPINSCSNQQNVTPFSSPLNCQRSLSQDHR